MTLRYLVLKDELREELEKLEKLFQKILADRKQYGEIEIYVDAAAMNLQSYYSGIERMLRAITVKIDGDTPSGERWHKDLLDQSAVEVPNLRPAVISKGLRDQLGIYLSFRHVVRNIYPYDLDAEQVEKLLNQLDAVHENFTNALHLFLEFVERVGNDT